MSRINPAAAARLSSSQLTGPGLLAMFQTLEEQMNVIQAEGNFVQFQFINDPGELQEGDLIPELHLSLRPYASQIVEQKATLVEGD